MTTTYQCSLCKKKASTKDEKKIPTCCGKPMKKIPVDICLQPDHPEHARPMDAEDACDDFRGGN
jgi:hypothetical protein